MKIHERLKVYRISHGIKQNYIAEKTGKSRTRISALETGRIKLTADEFEEICRQGLNIDPSIFFTNQFLETKNK